MNNNSIINRILFAITRFQQLAPKVLGSVVRACTNEVVCAHSIVLCVPKEMSNE
jgi:hypothetical protein